MEPKEMRIGFTCGAFDLLHAGHVLMLQEAAEVCDHLIVGLHIDPSLERPQKNAPVQDLIERYIQLDAVRYVDEVIPYRTEEEMHNLLRILRINVRIVGEEYRSVALSGQDVCEELGIQIYYNSRTHNLSSTELRERVLRSKLN